MSTTTAVRERPILFSAPMILAILDGHKTQTRRVVKPQPSPYHYLQPMWGTSPPPNPVSFGEPYLWREVGPDYPDDESDDRSCPYGLPGDRLWVREAHWRDIRWSRVVIYDATPEYAKYQNDIALTRCTFPNTDITHELPTGDEVRASMLPKFWKRKPSIHMPRWASRITLEITAVRVERLRDISAADAWAEGVRPDGVPAHAGGGEQDHADPEGATVDAYRALWDSINGKTHPWERNPWVWVVEFKRCEATNA